MALTLSDVSEMSTSSTDKKECLLSVAQIGDHLIDAATTFVDHRADFCALCLILCNFLAKLVLKLASKPIL